MPTAKLNDLNLYYERLGPEGAEALVFLHGALESFRSSWIKQIPFFSERFDVIGPDMRGHGQSDNPADALDLRQMADDVASLLDELKIDTAHICGFSGGGSVATFFALRHASRVRSLTLVSNNYALDDVRTGESDFWNVEKIKNEKPGWWKYLKELHPIGPERLLGWWAKEDRIRPNFSSADLGEIKMPALVVGGDRDPIIPLEQTIGLYHALPSAELCILPCVGHRLPRKVADQFNPIYADFLARLSSETS